MRPLPLMNPPLLPTSPTRLVTRAASARASVAQRRPSAPVALHPRHTEHLPRPPIARRSFDHHAARLASPRFGFAPPVIVVGRWQRNQNRHDLTPTQPASSHHRGRLHIGRPHFPCALDRKGSPEPPAAFDSRFDHLDVVPPSGGLPQRRRCGQGGGASTMAHYAWRPESLQTTRLPRPGLPLAPVSKNSALTGLPATSLGRQRGILRVMDGCRRGTTRASKRLFRPACVLLHHRASEFRARGELLTDQSCSHHCRQHGGLQFRYVLRHPLAHGSSASPASVPTFALHSRTSNDRRADAPS